MIVKDLSEHKGIVYVIMSGTCLVVSKINVIKESLPYGKESIRMVPYDKWDEVEITKYERKEDIFLIIRKLGKGDCFGIGEMLPQTSVISKHKVSFSVYFNVSNLHVNYIESFIFLSNLNHP